MNISELGQLGRKITGGGTLLRARRVTSGLSVAELAAAVPDWSSAVVEAIEQDQHPSPVTIQRYHQAVRTALDSKAGD